ncbi:hypothetical protein AVEN_150289-1 [Araneus ventricosus]|uniref:Uncharacterized protein n=1 Tax=Araneus ventricosus TaxID=182803 RepID=A0A4Y2TBK9_ARAVE|nr:hypothetical protein AVEN_113567-1 [Araneus ventricosus]GBN97947.1 hypothetical protein AVEN_173062-1 [Araneus ventricosus]GBN97971.1 hypothetical protein AVEN_180341-1 [Araneus ventricosus]GBN98006.1 hypothetical protein AVEN_150289-1 [Araneus ventricosus]
MSEVQNPDSCDGVSANISLHASSQSKCNSENVVKTFDYNLMNPSTYEESDINIQILESIYQHLDKEQNLKEANTVAFNLFKLSNKKSDFLMQMLSANILPAR